MKYRTLETSGVLYIFLALCCISQASERDKFQTTINAEDFRLPLSIIPVHYDLVMLPILRETEGYDLYTAHGSVSITVECRNTTRLIVLHANELTITEDLVLISEFETENSVPISEITYNEAVNFLQIGVKEDLQIGKKYIIYVPFIAKIRDTPLNGMYLDYYDDQETGETNMVATTLFAPYHARKAFPCFDEPDLRSTFNITLGRHSSHHSMSNGELLSSKPIDGLQDWFWDTFETTPSISPYIIAMIVSNFSYEEAELESFRNVTMRTYAAPHQIQRGGAVYAVNLAAKLLTYFENFFGVAYPLTKAYSVALPHFFFSAMENWGLITYKEDVILYFPGETTEDERFLINSVTSHELAHQWFGNLVNCEWWAYVWLKEGFASFYAYYGMNETNPELDPWTQFPLRVRQIALDFDVSAGTHPLENFPVSSEAVADIYTTIPYNKGASILRMTSKFLTEEVFHNGIRNYVDKFQYQGANQYDMFESLQQVVPENSLPAPVRTILETWTTQSGYPLLRVSATGPDQIRISQEKFIGEDTSSPNATWWVPVTVFPYSDSENDGSPDLWIPQGTREMTLDINTDLPIVNPESTGYYLVQYDSKLTGLIQQQLERNHNYFPRSVRSQIFSDFLTLGMFSGPEYVSIDVALNLTKYMNTETEVVVWRTVLSRMKQLNSFLVRSENYEAFQNYWIRKTHELLEVSDGWNNILEISDLKIELLEWLCLIKDPKLGSTASEIVQSWMTHPENNLIPVDLQYSMYCAAVTWENTTDIWDYLYLQLQTTESSVLRTRFVKALACSRRDDAIARLLRLVSGEDSSVWGLDKSELLNALANNPYANENTFYFIKNNISSLKLHISPKSIAEAINTLADFWIHDHELQAVHIFISRICTSELTTEMKSLGFLSRRVARNVKWMNEKASIATDFFSEN